MRQRANSLTEFIDSHAPRNESATSSGSPVRGSLEDPPTRDPTESSSRSRPQVYPKQSLRIPNRAPQHAFPPTLVESSTRSPNQQSHLSSSSDDAGRRVTNRKLARNQLLLSRQIEEVSTTLREMKEQLALVQTQIQNKG